MKPNELISLMQAYGFVLEEHKDKEKKWRFRGHGMFLDIWIGRRGVTMGTYLLATHTMKYDYRMDPSRIEEKVMELCDLYPI